MLHRAVVAVQHPQNHLAKAGLAAAALSHQTQDLIFFYIKAQIVKHHLLLLWRKRCLLHHIPGIEPFYLQYSVCHQEILLFFRVGMAAMRFFV